MTFVDMFSKDTWIFFLQTKSEALQTFINFKTQVENQFNTKIKALQTDEGGQFKSFTDFLKINGITHHFTCPYTSQQRGLVERKHRHIVYTGMMLFQVLSF